MPALLCMILGLCFPGEGTELPRSIADDELEGPAEPVLAAEERWPRDVFSWAQQPPLPQDKQAPPAAAPPPEREGAHSSCAAFFRSHGSGQAWEENVGRDYLLAPPVLIPVGLAVAAGVTKIWDKEIQKCLKDSLGNREWIGDAGMSVLLAGALATALFAPAEGRSSWDVLSEQLEAFALTGALTFGIKAGFPKRRPGGNGDDSFPSGHTSASFVGAALISQNLDLPWGAAAYGVAGLAGFSRIDGDRHFLSDVLAGAAIGIFSAGLMEALHWGTGREGKGIAGARLELEYADRGGSFSLAFRF